MKLLKLLILFGLLQTGLFAGEVEKVSKERDQILIAPEFGERFQVGDKVCVEGRNWTKVCGKVTRKKGSKAIAKMEKAVEGTRRGDPVSIQKNGSPNFDGGENTWEDSDWNRDSDGRQTRFSRREKNSLNELAFLIQAGATAPGFHSREGGGPDTKFTVRGTLGLGFNIPLDGGTFSFEPSFNYHTKGSNAEQPGVSGGFSFRYLELPFLFKIRFANEEVSPYFLLGPYLSYLVSARLYGDGEPGGTPIDQDFKEQMKDFDAGLMTGLGIDFAVNSSSRLGFQFFASWGLINIAREAGSLDGKNRELGLLANLAFNL